MARKPEGEVGGVIDQAFTESRDVPADWAAVEDDPFVFAVALVREHAELLASDAECRVVVLDEYRKERS